MIGVSDEACWDIGDVAVKAKPDLAMLATQAFEALIANGYGQFDQLIAVLAPAGRLNRLDGQARRLDPMMSGRARRLPRSSQDH